MSSNPLERDGLRAVVVGNGAIGTALCRALLSRDNVDSVTVLGRSAPQWEDDRLLHHRIDCSDPDSIEAAARAVRDGLGDVQLVINTVGVLHWDDRMPEKRVRALEPEAALHAFAVNAVFPMLLARSFEPLLCRDQPAVFASLSARVGSIEDNKLGGWYSYRASKAAHNMYLRTLAREWAVSRRQAIVVALHPGTVASPLSAPFVSKSYSNRVLQPEECAQALLKVIGSLTTEDTGTFFDWQGLRIPW